jgi:hypothetical protein
MCVFDLYMLTHLPIATLAFQTAAFASDMRQDRDTITHLKSKHCALKVERYSTDHHHMRASQNSTSELQSNEPQLMAFSFIDRRS